MTCTQKHHDKMAARRDEQLSRRRSHRYVDKSKYKGSRIPTDWYGFRLELVAEAFRNFGKTRT